MHGSEGITSHWVLFNLVELRDFINLIKVLFCQSLLRFIHGFDSLLTLTLDNPLNLDDTANTQTGPGPLFPPAHGTGVAELHSDEHHEAVYGLAGARV